MDFKVDFSKVSSRFDKQNQLLSLTDCRPETWNLICDIKNIDLAIQWVRDGNDLKDFYLLEQNKCDLKLAFEINRIIKILK